MIAETTYYESCDLRGNTEWVIFFTVGSTEKLERYMFTLIFNLLGY